MIDLEFIEQLIRSMDESSLDSIELERGGTRIRLAKTPSGPVAAQPAPIQPAPAAPPASGNPHPAAPPATGEDAESGTESAGGDDAGAGLVEVTSPMVGTFYRAASPDADPFTTTGASIATGDVLCIIEAMKLMNELEAEFDGTVREICVENGEPVEYGQVLFRVEPS